MMFKLYSLFNCVKVYILFLKYIFNYTIIYNSVYTERWGIYNIKPDYLYVLFLLIIIFEY